jgi:hypothetical protein
MRTVSLRIQSVILVGMFLLEGLAGCSGSDRLVPGRSQDDAMLLMISSTTRILEGEGVAAGVLRPGMAPILQAGRTSNEIGILVGIYEDLYGRYAENLAAFDPQLAEKFSDRLADEYQAKVEPLLARKAKLDASRRRRRWGLFRAIGRGLGRFAKFIGRTTVTIVREVGRELAQRTVTMVKQRVRELFEGRVNTFIARLASKFGPLGPFVQGKLKAALDRWWIRTRDRVSGRLARQATQTAEAGVAAAQLPAEGEAEPAEAEPQQVPIDESEFGGDECDPSGAWYDDYWEQIAVPALKQDHKYCSDWSPYSSCVYEQARQGVCEEEAHAACEALYEAIPPVGGGATVTIVDDAVYHLDADNHFDITFSLHGGPVSGYAAWDWWDNFFGEGRCYVNSTFTFKGSYDPDTCILSGTGVRTMEKHEVEEGDCLGVGDSYEETIPFRMDLHRGTLNTCAEPPSSPLCLLEEIGDYLK